MICGESKSPVQHAALRAAAMRSTVHIGSDLNNIRDNTPLDDSQGNNVGLQSHQFSSDPLQSAESLMTEQTLMGLTVWPSSCILICKWGREALMSARRMGGGGQIG